MKPICLYCNVFELKESQQSYVDIFYIWLTYVIKYADLKKDDRLVMIIDEPTLKKLTAGLDQTFSILITQLSCNYAIIQTKQPDNILQGMMRRYNIFNYLDQPLDQSGYIYIYSDIDNLIIRPVSRIISKTLQKPDDISSFMIVETQGKLTDTDYWGAAMDTGDKQWLADNNFIADSPGFSSGLFAFSWGQPVKHLFDAMLNSKKNTGGFYTVDQPVYNDVLVNYIYRFLSLASLPEYHIEFFPIPAILMQYNIVDLNGEGGGEEGGGKESQETTVINYCGEPGIAREHWRKMFTNLIVRFLASH